MMPYQELAFKPGTKYSYSNPGFVYLARIVEQITGDPWEAYVQKNIFTPLGLTRSYFNTTPYHLAADRSNNYYVVLDTATMQVRVKANGREFNPGITIPNGGWNAPLADIATYIAFLTNASHGDARTQKIYDTILPHAVLERMWQPRYPITLPARADSTGEWEGTSFFIQGSGEGDARWAHGESGGVSGVCVLECGDEGGGGGGVQYFE
jgi:CubicO group peptidase (beta-lactamase class C family)